VSRSSGRSSLLAWLARRAADDRNSVTITIAPSRADRTVQLELPRWAARLLLGCVIGGGGALVIGAIAAPVLLGDHLEHRRVQGEVVRLRAQIGTIEELEERVRQLDQTRRQLFELAGIPSQSDSIGRGSLGGMAFGGGDAGMDAAALTDTVAGTPFRRVPFRGPISRGFASNRDREPDHAGVDVAGAVGSPILAAADGIVEFAGWDETFGYLLVLRHRDNWETRYGHNQSLFVQEGDTVIAGRRISSIGSTGRSSAPHLHFEVLRDGAPLDPAKYFRSYRGAVSENDIGDH